VLVAEDGGSDGQHWAGQSRILGPKWMRFPALTVGLVGLQVFWSVEMSYGAWRSLSHAHTSSLCQQHRLTCSTLAFPNHIWLLCSSPDLFLGSSSNPLSVCTAAHA
jgi:hypothetical protein